MAQVSSALDSSLAPSTWTQYTRTWKRYSDFAINVLLSKPVLPIPLVNIKLFLAILHKKELSVPTLRSIGSAIFYLHELNPTDAFIIKKLFQGLASGETSGDIRLPITRGLLHNMLRAIPPMCTCYTPYSSPCSTFCISPLNICQNSDSSPC